MQHLSTDIQRRLIDDLGHLISERAQSEVAIRNSFEARDATLRSQFAGERERFMKRWQAEKEALTAQHNSALAAVVRECDSGLGQATVAHDQTYREAIRDAESARSKAVEQCEKTKELAQSDFEEAVRDAKAHLSEFKSQLEAKREELQLLDAAVIKETLKKRWCRRAARQLPLREGRCESSKPLEWYAAERAAAEELRRAFHRQWIPQLLRKEYLVVLFVLSFLVLFGISIALDKIDYPYVIMECAGALGFTAIVWVVIRQPAVRQTLDLYGQFQQRLANADKGLDVAKTLTAAEADQRHILQRQDLERTLRQADSERQSRLQELEAERDRRKSAAQEKLQTQKQSALETRDRKQRETNDRFLQRARELQATFHQESEALQQRHDHELAAARESFDRAWQRLVERWSSGLREFRMAVDDMQAYCAARFPSWTATNWSERQPVEAGIPSLKFGDFRISLKMFDSGIPVHADLRPAQTDFVLPAVMSYSQHPALLFESFGEGRIVASRAMQNIMLRLLTALPAGKVRFTIIDPVGLGQNFSAFMHLADFDEKLVTHRIWTEPMHIAQRLSDLTEHMEGVIQTYLRNEFRTIDEYNAFAGEVAEPFHVLVVANYPAGFTEEASQRLLSIVASGARCGVYTLISTDAKIELPRNFDLADLEANATTVQWNGQRFHWLDQDIKDLPLTLDEPPADEKFTEIIRTIGQRAKEAIRVEVPFSTVAPAEDHWWRADSRSGIDIALGRAGATKLQHLRLGKGTSQHVLISGKTGSGKSTLLHALIANTALNYGPDEVQFYLIDFKKGVEFKPYASHALPHARVVAIESEREFGMSVLERLDLELRQRGDLFRDHGVQDIKNYRDRNPQAKLPRLLLVIDEFQEFFVQDDKLAQDAALLLDRLVRQGRAFGIHVLLGSQTLAGAYSLARSTIGQMAVRIALQCSEADSHLILSEDNTAARLLNRPGEAIYNDANGMFEGNHPFQVVWLGAHEQEQYLRRLADKVRSEMLHAVPPVVFEGNAPANPAENGPLRELLECDEPPTAVAPVAWLGSAVAIKDPTSIAFRRQSGQHLLIVGQHEDQALGVLGSCVISLAAGMANGAAERESPAARFIVLDGARPESPEAGFWQNAMKQLPIAADVMTPAQAAGVIDDVAREMRRRIESSEDSAPPIFLLIHNLSRFRDLRRAEDDFSFSSLDEDKPANPGKQLAEILREGPAVGVHLLIWCDSYNNVSRWLDRQTLRDVEYRVLFQMSANDSSNLMETPGASRLGTHRAILYSDEQGESEKFRPYAPPSDEWLAWVRERLKRNCLPAGRP